MQIGNRGVMSLLIKDKNRVAVPNLTQDLKPGTLRSTIQQSGLTLDEFTALL